MKDTFHVGFRRDESREVGDDGFAGDYVYFAGGVPGEDSDIQTVEDDAFEGG